MVWTPTINPTSVAVALDPAFARACSGHVLDEQKQMQLKQHVWGYMGKRGHPSPGDFLNFHNNSLLVNVIHYKRGEGVWMAMDTFPRKEFPVMYHDHNADHFPDDRLWLLHAFGAWATAAIGVLDWK